MWNFSYANVDIPHFSARRFCLSCKSWLGDNSFVHSKLLPANFPWKTRENKINAPFRKKIVITWNVSLDMSDETSANISAQQTSEKCFPKQTNHAENQAAHEYLTAWNLTRFVVRWKIRFFPNEKLNAVVVLAFDATLPHSPSTVWRSIQSKHVFYVRQHFVSCIIYLIHKHEKVGENSARLWAFFSTVVLQSII